MRETELPVFYRVFLFCLFVVYFCLFVFVVVVVVVVVCVFPVQVTMTCIKGWMSLNCCKIGPLTTKLDALEDLKNQCFHFFAVAIELIHSKLADNKDINKILDEFEFRGVSCP